MSATATMTCTTMASTQVATPGRMVRFHSDCVLIPEQVTLSKGLLGRRSASRSADKRAPSSSSSRVDASTKERGKLLNISLPSFASPKRNHSSPPLSTIQDGPTIPSSWSSSFTVGGTKDRTRRGRSVSLPPSFDTIPLRDCCKACAPAVDAYFASPDMPERMTKGATRLKLAENSGFQSIVRADELDIIKEKADSEVSDEVSLIEDSTEVMKGPEPCKLKLAISRSAIEDDENLFPLPSPRGSPKNSPIPSPNSSQTNLTGTGCISPRLVSPKKSPLSSCYMEAKEHNFHSPCAQELPPACPLESSSSANNRSPKKRRPSLSEIGSHFSRGSSAMLSGVARLALANDGRAAPGALTI